MTFTLLELWEIYEEEVNLNQDPPLGNSPLMTSGEDSKAMQVVRSGMDLRKEGDFWKDFITLCSNSAGMAELLGVKESEVRRWSGRINNVIKEVEDTKNNDLEGKSSHTMIPTGDEPIKTYSGNIG